MAIIEIVYYGIVFSVTLIFSMMAIAFKKEEVHFKFIAGVCWFILAIVHFLVGDITSVLTYAIAVFWMGLGFLFTILGIQDFFNMKRDKIWGFGN